MQPITNTSLKERLAAAEPVRAKLSVATRSETRLLNRELSLVEFFRQVLDEAHDKRNPVLERLRFVTIFSYIVDEFFMVRVSGLKEEVEHGYTQPSPDGLTAAQQLEEIRNRIGPMMADATSVLRDEILPELAQHGVEVAPYASLSKVEREQANEYFAHHVFPVLTPLAVDPVHPFPYISGLSLNFGILVGSASSEDEKGSFVRLKVPQTLPGLVPVGPHSKFTLLSEIIAANLGSLFPGMDVF